MEDMGNYGYPLFRTIPIFAKNSTERWPCSVVLPTRNKKNMLPSAGSISFNVVHSVVLRKGNSPKTIMQQNEHLHIITL